MAKTKYKRTHFYSIGSMLTDEEVHQVWEIVGNALDRNGFTDADGELSIRVYDETLKKNVVNVLTNHKRLTNGLQTIDRT